MIEQLKKLASAATPGPWEAKAHTAESIQDLTACDDWTVYGKDGTQVCYEAGPNPNVPNDVVYICAANPQAILHLIAVAEKMAEALSTCEKKVFPIGHGIVDTHKTYDTDAVAMALAAWGN